VKIAVIGLGKMGLPFAVNASKHGHFVTGCDINSEVVDAINAGKSPVQGEPELDTQLRQSVASGTMVATTDLASAVSVSEAVVVLVPVYVDANGIPEFTSIDSVTLGIAKALKPGTLVSFETTLPVGTTRKRFVPVLEKISNLKADEDFYVCFSPERVSSGSVMSDLRRYPKLVGGIGDASEKVGIKFYESVLSFDVRTDLPKPNGVWPMGSAEASELAKLAETTYRDVNIALANTFALHAADLGVDVYKVIEACNSQPFSHIHRPGIAVGGHCIPVYPNMYLAGDPGAVLVSEARKLNLSMIDKAVGEVKAHLGGLSGKKVAVLGLAYRGGVKEHAFSGALYLVDRLRDLGAEAMVHDPLYDTEEISKLGLDEFQIGDFCDAVILHTEHKEYKSLNPEDFPKSKAFYDGRNFAPSSIRSMPGYMCLGLPS
jgi:UDP-N-acetyl-D-glucosamine dehydrogenase